ncbi:pyridoxamine 5'-phosphate oxidase family protein [Dictyobacter kobayashii]|uniref:General stress protein n=1 Tax=Dictyobacter kobayashii TaxID=2014872 RepID=A0A402AN24_9CHLR|nr:pyridoxamine 5'-phosphate oxidase family protein [Dictyobacter kobayashii]GCE20516.1 general stress protein [Dictyobacter kobayashii]
MSAHTENKSDTKLLSEKIKDIRMAMMTTIEPDGSLHSRPMATQDFKALEFDGDLWFLTYVTSPKVEDVQQHQQVNLSYSKPGDNLFVSVSGTAQIVQDRQKIKDLWNPFFKTWFPNGEDDPNIVLLKVHVQSAEYWDAPSGKMGLLYTIVKGLTTHGEKQAGEDVKLNMQ